MLKKVSAVLVIFLICICTAAVIVGYKVNDIIKHPFINKQSKFEVKVKSGDTINSIIDNLENKKNTFEGYVIKWYIKKEKFDTNIKPGSYYFSNEVTIEKFMSNLRSGLYNENAVKVTIPEGYNLEQIAKLLEDKKVISKEEFLKACSNYTLPSYIKEDSKRKYALEGFLFPDTYEFLYNMNGKDIIDAMTSRFEYVFKEAQKNKNLSVKNEDIDKIVIMASIIEKEVSDKNERGEAASVFYNRISKKMKLESCATVLYALGVEDIYKLHKDGRLYYNDLKVNSPYNTYLIDGLPEGPISNPGIACIEAALDPSKTDYLYFVSTNDGKHFFTSDYKKFEEMKTKYQGN